MFSWNISVDLSSTACIRPVVSLQDRIIIYCCVWIKTTERGEKISVRGEERWSMAYDSTRSNFNVGRFPGKLLLFSFFFYNLTSANNNIVSKLPMSYLRRLHIIGVYNDQTTDENLILARLCACSSHDPHVTYIHMYVYVSGFFRKKKYIYIVSRDLYDSICGT